MEEKWTKKEIEERKAWHTKYGKRSNINLPISEGWIPKHAYRQLTKWGERYIGWDGHPHTWSELTEEERDDIKEQDKLELSEEKFAKNVHIFQESVKRYNARSSRRTTGDEER